MSNKQEILESLKPLFKEAVKHKLFFRSKYQGIIFSPKRLKEEHAAGCFIWDFSNWILVNPPELINIEEKIKELELENIRIQHELDHAWDIE